jgi:hypothetical protein
MANDSARALARRDSARDDPAFAKTFISYSRRDSSRVESIVKELTNRGVECWIDRRKIRVGSAWPHELCNALDSCGSVIVFLSSNSARKDSWVHNEVAYAAGLGTKLIVPVYLSSKDARLGELDLIVARLQKIFAGGRRVEAIADEIAAALGLGTAVPLPRMSWVTRFLFVGSRRQRLELRRIGPEEVFTTNLIVPCDKPLRVYPTYSEISINDEQHRCTIVEGQVGAGKSVFIAELVDRNRRAFDFVFAFSAEETERIFSSESQSSVGIWGALAIKMIERRRSYGLGKSAGKFPAKDFLFLLSKSRVLFVLEDLHLVPFELQVVTRSLNRFFQECRIPAANLYLIASSRRETITTDPWITRHSQTIKLLPLADISEGRADGKQGGPAAQEVLWSLCHQAGHDPAILTSHRELFAQALPSHHLKTPLFMALTALVSSPSGGGLPLNRALKLRAAELIDFYIRVLMERAPSLTVAIIMGSDEASEKVHEFKHFLLLLILEGIRGKRVQMLASNLAKRRQLEPSNIESAIDASVISGILVREKIRDEIAFPHDAIEEYLLAWGFVHAKIDDYEAWRRRCRNREEGLADMLLGLLRTGEDWQRLAYENLHVAVDTLLAEKRDRRAGRQSPWTTDLDGPQLANFITRWAAEGAPFDVKGGTWRTIGDSMQSLGIEEWGQRFLKAIREVRRPSKPGARAVLETNVGRSSDLLTAWAKTDNGRIAIAQAMIFPESQAGFLDLVSGRKSTPSDIADLLRVWWLVRDDDAGGASFHTEVETIFRNMLSNSTEDELKMVLETLTVEQACFVARLSESAAYNAKRRMARAYARTGRSLLMVCPGTYQVQRGNSVSIADPVLVPLGYESVAQSNRELDARNQLVGKVTQGYDLMTWDEVLVAAELGSSGLIMIPNPKMAVEVFRDPAFPNGINFVRHGSTARSDRPTQGGALVVTTASGRRGADGYDFFEGLDTVVYARRVLRPKSAIRPARKPG